MFFTRRQVIQWRRYVQAAVFGGGVATSIILSGYPELIIGSLPNDNKTAHHPKSLHDSSGVGYPEAHSFGQRDGFVVAYDYRLGTFNSN